MLRTFQTGNNFICSGCDDVLPMNGKVFEVKWDSTFADTFRVCEVCSKQGNLKEFLCENYFIPSSIPEIREMVEKETGSYLVTDGDKKRIFTSNPKTH